MKKSILLLILLAIGTITFAQNQTTFILVRHAEKADDGTKNPPLNEVGVERALNIANMLEKQDIVALYSTPYKRTQETLQPLADNKGLEVQEYDPYAKGEWLSTLIEKHGNGTIVISGHSNTIPILANALLGDETFAQFDDSDYSNFIIIMCDEVGKGKLMRLSF
jgi:2,3-bisphosphoglycerate-dependent phosphoglycerate mutase